MNLGLTYLKNNLAGVAQLVELLTCNEGVARSIRVASLMRQFWIFSWSFEFVWAGTQVAKGGRLSKGSVLPKGRMEK